MQSVNQPKISIKDVNRDYKNLEDMLDINPLHVTILPSGSFQHYYNRRKGEGCDLAHLKPPHMNASDEVIRDLLKNINASGKL